MIGIILSILLVILASTMLYQKLKLRYCTSKKLLYGKTALVTGGTTGMGLEVATELARRGGKVIVASHCPLEGQTAVHHITERTGSSKVDFLLLDLGSFEDTRRAVKEIYANHNKLDILINNAGVAGPEKTTKDGFNHIIQVNYLGSVLLTILLLPLLRKSSEKEPSRIVNVASFLHIFGTVKSDYWRKSCVGSKAYANSKMCMVTFTTELVKRLKSKSQVVVNSLEPGTVNTGIYKTWNSRFNAVVIILVKLLFKTPWQGAQTTLHVALDEKAGDVTGQYFSECEVSKQSKVCNAIDSAQLWEDSLEAVQLSADEVSMALFE